MKIRTDFVTNSSSSSFIIAREEELSENLKEIIVKFVLDEMLGEKMLSPDSTEEEIQAIFKENYLEDENQREIRRALKEGKTVYEGWVSFEDSDYGYADLFKKLWQKMVDAESKNFEIIDGALDY